MSRHQNRKIFLCRNSLLTDLFKNDHIRTIYNVAVAFLISFVIRTMVVDLFEKGYIDFDFDLMKFSFEKLDLAIKACSIMFASLTLAFYPLFHYWAGRRNIVGFDTVDKILTIIYCLYVSGKLGENDNHSTGNGEDYANPCPPFSTFLYFLVAPTLIYRDNYPMTPKTRWCEVVKSLVQIVMCLLAVHYIFAHFCVAEFQNFNVQHVSFKEFVHSWFKSIIPASACFLVMFFLILHSWHNVTAEILRFGDRLFYEDWWTAHNLSTYYRKWNVIVHDWLHDYVYLDAVQILSLKPAFAAVLVFNLSAIFHEYLIILAFKFCYPVLFVQFFILSVPILFLTKCLKSGQFLANSLFWLTITTGIGLSLSLYAMEYFARRNCRPTFKYYPPDFDPRKIPKGRFEPNRQYVIRCMAPFNMRCNTCGEYIYKGKKFNARRETVQDEDYLGLSLFRFYIRCPGCLAEITFKTDLKNCDYTQEHGATRLFEAEKLLRQEQEKVQKQEEEDKTNPMKMLETRTKMSRFEMESLERLEELREINMRKLKPNYEKILKDMEKEKQENLKRQEQEDEDFVKAVFGQKRMVEKQEGEKIEDLGPSTSSEFSTPKIKPKEEKQIKKAKIGVVDQKKLIKNLIVRKKLPSADQEKLDDHDNQIKKQSLQNILCDYGSSSSNDSE